jgi:hypothetical protein
MTRRTLSPAAWAAIVAGHLAVTSLIWRDIRRRPDDQIRGSKNVWRVATAANSANSVAYLLFGRKRAGAPGPT